MEFWKFWEILEIETLKLNLEFWKFWKWNFKN